MTRRITLAMVAIVLATLLVVGLGTFSISQFRARRTTEAELHQQTVRVIQGVTDPSAATSADPASVATAITTNVALLRRVKDALHLDDIAVILVSRNDLITGDPLPAKLTNADLPLARLRAGEIVTGVRSGVVYSIGAVAVGPQKRGLAVLVTTRRINAGVGAAIRWFILASLVALALAALIAWWLGDRLAKPVRDASHAAHRIASGELGTRLVPPAPHDHDEVAELARSLNAMAESLERSKGLEQQFLLSVSHDLRTPLTSIRGYAEAIGDGAGDPRQHAGVILGESKRLERLVADLIDLAKLQAHAFTFATTRVELGAIVSAGAEGFRPEADERGIRVDVLIGDPVWIVADPDRLGQVTANFVENALKYARTVVTVGTSLSTVLPGSGAAPAVTLFVDDDGPGIAAADLPHVFERLYVARHQPPRAENGSGLGLAIVRELVTSMGGNVSAGVAPSGGARMCATFPVA